MNMRSV